MTVNFEIGQELTAQELNAAFLTKADTPVQLGSLFMPTGGLVGNSAAGPAGIISIGTGLSIVGSSLTISIASAPPTGLIGLTPVAGSALTVMLSDSAPALSQAIIPTWTGLHTFTGGIVANTITVGTLTLTNPLSLAAINLPTTSDISHGVITINGASFLSAFAGGSPSTPQTFIGVNAGNFTATGERNTGFGLNVMPIISSATFNVGVGDSSLGSLTSGSQNVALGFAALLSAGTGNANIAVGFEAMIACTSGGTNIAIGVSTMSSMVSGNGNIAIGQQALNTLTANDGFAGPHIAIGNMAMQNYNDASSTGLRNTAIGHDSTQALVLGGNNTSLGFESSLFAGRHDGSQTINGQTALGALALCYNTDGSFNTAIGYFAMFGNGRADSPTFGSNNMVQCTAVGANTLLALGNGSNITAIGYAALSNLTDGGNNNTVVGANSGLGITTGQNNTILGANAPTFAATTTGLVFIGDGLGGRYFHNFAGSGSGSNLFVGGNAGNFILTTAAQNLAVGNNSLLRISTGANNTAVGNSALGSCTTGNQNVAIGTSALTSMVDGISNFALGIGCMQSQTTGSGSIAIGASVLSGYTGSGPNTAVGFVNLFELTIGTGNVVFGYNSGRGLTTGSNNTILGGNVGSLATGLSNSIIFADGAGNIRLDYGKSLASAWTMAGNLLLGGVTSSFPALNRSGVAVAFRLADNSADAGITVGTIAASGVSALAGGATTITRLPGDSTTNVATTAFVTAAVAGGGASPGNPTAPIGLAAVNGTAITFMRSDGAPALSQGIVPTWTGLHTFSGGAIVLTRAFDDSTTNAASTAFVQQALTGPGYTVSALPSGVAGKREYVTDALAPAFLGHPGWRRINRLPRILCLSWRLGDSMTVPYGNPYYTPEMFDPLAGMTPLAISSMTWSANVATVTTTAPHGLTGTRQLVMFATFPVYYNGTFSCAITGASTFTYPLTPFSYALTASNSATWSGGVATINTNVAHGLTGTMSITIASVSVSGYNGTFTCTVNGPSTFTYSVAGPLSNGNGGTYAVVIASPATTPGTWAVDSTSTFATIANKARANGSYLRLVFANGKTYLNTNPYIFSGIRFLYLEFNGAKLINPITNSGPLPGFAANVLPFQMQNCFLTNAPGLFLGGGPSGQEYFGGRIKSVKAGNSTIQSMAVPIATLTWLGGLVTVTTVIPHNLMVSQNLVIAGFDVSQYNGTPFCTVGAASAFPKSAITSLVWSGGVVTATTTAPHGFTTGSQPPFNITGASLSGFNVTGVTCTITGASSFTYPLVTNPGGTGTGASWNVYQLSAFTFPLVSNPGAPSVIGTFAAIIPLGRVLIFGFGRTQGTASFPPTMSFLEYNSVESVSADGLTGFMVNDTANDYDDKWPEDSFSSQNCGAARIISLNRSPSGDSWDLGFVEHEEAIVSDCEFANNPNFVDLTDAGIYQNENSKTGPQGGKLVRFVNCRSGALGCAQAENIELINCVSGQTEIDKGIYRAKIVGGQYGIIDACIGTEIVECEDVRVGVGIAMAPTRLLSWKRGTINGRAVGGTAPLYADYTWGSQKSIFEQVKFVAPDTTRQEILGFISYTGVFTVISPTTLMLNRADYVSSRICQPISAGSVFRNWAGLPAFKVSRLPYCEGNQATGDVWIDGTVIYPLASPAFAITSLVFATGTVTATTTQAHGLTINSMPSLTIAGADASYNGTFTVTVTGTSAFTYPLGSTPSGTNTGTWTGNILRIPSSNDITVKDPLFYGQYASQITSFYGNNWISANGGLYPMARVRDRWITDSSVKINSSMNIPQRASNRFAMAIGHQFMIAEIVIDVIRAASAASTLNLTARDTTGSTPTLQGQQTLFTSIDLTTVGRRVVGTGSGGNFTNLLGADSNAGGLMTLSTNLLEWQDTSAGPNNSALSWNIATISALSWSAGTATAVIASTLTNVTSGTYNSGSGLVTIVAPGATSAPGDTIVVAGATGTGSFASINGSFTAGAGTTGNTVTFTIATGLTMTITGGNVTRVGHGLTIGGTFYLGFSGNLPGGYNGNSLRCTIVDAVTITYPVTVNPGTETALGTVGWVGAVCSAHGLTIGSYQNLIISNANNVSGYTPIAISSWAYLSRVEGSPVGGGDIGSYVITTSTPHNMLGSTPIILAGIFSGLNGTWPAAVIGPNTISFEVYNLAFANSNPLPSGGTVAPVLSYNGTYPCTITGTTTYTYPMALNVGLETVPGQVNNPNCAEWSITYYGAWIEGYD